MITITSDGANKLLKELQQKRELLIKEIEDLSTYVAAVTEDEKELKPDFHLDETVENIKEIDAQIIKIRYAKTVFNNTTYLDCGMTIGEALVQLPLLTEEVKLYKAMAFRQPKARKTYGYGESPKEIEYVYVSYDIQSAKEKYELASKKLMEMQQLINVANTTVTFEIDIVL